VTPADFEITAWLTARALRAHVAPNARLETTDGGAALTRGEAQTFARETVERRDTRTNVIIKKRVVAVVRVGAVGDDARTKPAGGGQ
jgi:hypothetical protein